MNEKEGTRLCGWRVDEGMRRKEEGSHGEGGGMETFEAAVPGRGAARERRWRFALDDAHHVAVIDVNTKHI